MRAVRIGGPKGTARLEQVELPVESEGHAIVRMQRVSLGPADVIVAMEMREDDPMTMGREGVGILESVGAGVDESLVGKRVAFETRYPCRVCELCKTGLSAHCADRLILGGMRGFDGCLADFVSIPATGLLAVPDGVDDEAALFAGAVAQARHASVRVRIEGRPYITILGDSREALVMGQVMSKLNAQVRVIGWDEDRLTLCEKWGVRHRRADEPGLHEDQDVVIDCAGTLASAEIALAMIRPRGTILATVRRGVSFLTEKVVRKELDILGCSGGTVADGIAAIKQGIIDPTGLITKRVSMDEAVSGVRAMAVGELGVSIEF